MPELVPIRHGRMIVSPFTFYRGSAAIMAWDLSRTPTTGLRVQCCGDAHLSNFGVFAAPDRRLVFDLNDFDETLPAPFEWDVKRLAASFVVAARDNGHRRKEQRAAARAAAAAYRTTMAKAATMRFLDVWYARFDADKLIAELAATADKAAVKAAQKALAKAQTRTSLGSLAKFAERVDGGYRIKQQPPVIVRPPETMSDEFEQIIRRGTRRLRELAGARSARRARPLPLRGFRAQGRRRRLGRDRGVDDPADGRPRGRSPVPADQGGRPRRCSPRTRAPASTSTRASGWCTASGSCRPRATPSWAGSPAPASTSASSMSASCATRRARPRSRRCRRARLATYGELCGATLARAHARTGDAAKITGYLGDDDTFDRALERFAVAYADQNDADYAAFTEAADEQRIEVERGV